MGSTSSLAFKSLWVHNWWSRLELLEECLLVPGQRQSATPGRGPGIWSLSRSQLLKTLAIYHKPTIWGWFIKFIPPLYGDFGDDLSLGLPWFTHFSQGHSDPTGAGFTRDSWQDLQSSLECCGGTRVAWQGRLDQIPLSLMWSLVNVYSSLLEMDIESSLIYWKLWFPTVMLVYQVTFGVCAPSWFPSKVWSEMAQMWREDLGAKADPLRYGLLGIWLSFPDPQWKPPMETPNGNPQWKPPMETYGNHGHTPNGKPWFSIGPSLFSSSLMGYSSGMVEFLQVAVMTRYPCCFAVRLREVDAVGRWLASILRVFSQGLVMKRTAENSCVSCLMCS